MMMLLRRLMNIWFGKLRGRINGLVVIGGLEVERFCA